MGCALSSEPDKHEVNALANRPPIPKSHPVLDSLIDALEAEFVSETEGALTQWLEQTLPNFGGDPNDRLPDEADIEGMKGGQLRELCEKAGLAYQDCNDRDQLNDRARQALASLKATHHGAGVALLAQLGCSMEAFLEWVEYVRDALSLRATSVNNLKMIWKCKQHAPKPVAVAQPTAQVVAQPVAMQPQAMMMPGAQAVAQPMMMPSAQPIAQPMMMPGAQAVAQPMMMPGAQAVAQPMMMPMGQPVAQPAMAMPVAQPVYQPGRI